MWQIPCRPRQRVRGRRWGSPTRRSGAGGRLAGRHETVRAVESGANGFGRGHPFRSFWRKGPPSISYSGALTIALNVALPLAALSWLLMGASRGGWNVAETMDCPLALASPGSGGWGGSRRLSVVAESRNREPLGRPARPRVGCWRRNAAETRRRDACATFRWAAWRWTLAMCCAKLSRSVGGMSCRRRRLGPEG